jgi:hypothetical protein
MAVEKIYTANPIDIMYSGIMFVQKWRSLLKESDQGKITRLLEKMQSWLRQYNPVIAQCSDIGEPSSCNRE